MVPRLRVRRDWHEGLNPDHVDHRCASWRAGWSVKPCA